MLVLRAVRKTYSAGAADALLHDLDLTLHDGEYLAVMGESGAGKSTLLNLIAGLEQPDAGRILLDDVDVGALDDDGATRLRRRAVGFIFQAFHVLPQLTVAQNVALPLLLLGVARAEARRRVDALLDAVGLASRRASLPRDLSGGQLQRVAVARALVHRPRLVLADEPTGNLDEKSATQILALLRQQIKADPAQRTMGILVTHSSRAAASADRILCLTGGRLSACRAAPAPA